METLMVFQQFPMIEDLLNENEIEEDVEPESQVNKSMSERLPWMRRREASSTFIIIFSEFY